MIPKAHAKEHHLDKILSNRREDATQAMTLHVALFSWFCFGQGVKKAENNTKL